MKRFAILCGLVAAFLCLAQNANAQYARKGADLVDQNKVVLSDQDIINLVGNDVFDQTVVGARKQYKAGRGLITGGIIGIGAGLAGSVLAGVKAANDGYRDFETAVEDDGAVLAMYLGSVAALSLGSAALTAGIPLKIIGKKRLDWVSEEANRVSGNVSLNVGATPHGMGIVLNF
ncbi:MAG: hypothetical protein IJ893_07555 [Bacteroidales bacterium]|nr:hypothetical protein [Bacteroidales bacterium]